MLGMVFVAFVDWAEKIYGEVLTDELLTHTPLHGGGGYTAVGQYPHEDMLKLMVGLSSRVERPLPELCREFGQELLRVLMVKHAHMMPSDQTLLDFLQTLQRHIHGEVVKLYPQAQTPTVNCEARTDSSMRLHYVSSRPMADVAEGLLLGAIAHFKQPARLMREDPPDSDGKQAWFTLELLPS